jgi:hypothetical protein
MSAGETAYACTTLSPLAPYAYEALMRDVETGKLLFRRGDVTDLTEEQ